MAVERPWVTPEEVKSYSEVPCVQQRDNSKIEMDILRAEEAVINYTNNNFSDCDTIPSAVKTAIMLLAEAYGYKAVTSTTAMQSETYDDYTYTAKNSEFNISDLDCDILLKPYVKSKSSGNARLRMKCI